MNHKFLSNVVCRRQSVAVCRRSPALSRQWRPPAVQNHTGRSACQSFVSSGGVSGFVALISGWTHQREVCTRSILVCGRCFAASAARRLGRVAFSVKTPAQQQQPQLRTDAIVAVATHKSHIWAEPLTMRSVHTHAHTAGHKHRSETPSASPRFVLVFKLSRNLIFARSHQLNPDRRHYSI